MEEYNPKKISLENYKAALLLATAGDSMGCKNEEWELNKNGADIHRQMMELTKGKGVMHLSVSIAEGWRYSDDTVMQMATAQALINAGKKCTFNQICESIGKQYKKCWRRMEGRGPGKTTSKYIQFMKQDGSNWNQIPFGDTATGCGGAMRAASIGLVFYHDIKTLIGLSIEAGRMTHHNPIGYLGSMVASYFTALAVLQVEPKSWIGHLFEVGFPAAKKHVQQSGRQVELNFSGNFWSRFVDSWDNYAKKRKLSKTIKNPTQPQFPDNYGLEQRQLFYQQVGQGGWPGRNGFDSVIISYDALLSCRGSWEQFCLRGILHGGDNDSTGAIGGAWFGAYYGFKGVPQKHYIGLEDSKLITDLGQSLFKVAKN